MLCVGVHVRTQLSLVNELPGGSAGEGRSTYRGPIFILLIIFICSPLCLVVKIVERTLASTFMVYEAVHFRVSGHKISALQVHCFFFVSDLIVYCS